MTSPETMRCLGCGYDLHGLPENRCPECGLPFDPADPGTSLLSADSGRKYLVAAIASLGMLTLPLLALGLIAGTDWYIQSWASWFLDVALVLVWCCGLVTAGLVCIHGIQFLRRPAHLVKRRGSAVAGVGLLLLMAGIVVVLIVL
jgi:hypothetical protein